LRDATIAPERRHLYGGVDVCRHGCGSEPHYSRLIGIYDTAADRTGSWRCPDCGHEEPRDG